MSIIETRISPRITLDTTFRVRQPARTKVYHDDGTITQVFTALTAKHEVDLTHGVKDRSDFQELVDAFYAVMFGGYEGLRVRNWQDYKLTLTNSAVDDLGGGTYQIQRKHTFGAVTVYRDIIKPVSGTIAVFDASDTPLTPTVNYATGTFTVLSGTPAKVTGEFDLPMTFVNDEWVGRFVGRTEEGPLIDGEPILMEEL
jgi:uncharacterized protein (TIGR02217 family)